MTETCPSCHVSLQGEPIPVQYREHYEDGTHYSRKIGVYDQKTDRVIKWRCPDCKGEWGRA